MKCSSLEFIKLSKNILDKEAYLRFLAKGRSMYPTIRDGDIVNIESVKKREIRLGDVVFYRNNEERMVMHRVIKKRMYSNRVVFITRGDANRDEEEVFLNQILGRVRILERKGRKTDITQGWGKLSSLISSSFFYLLIKFRRVGSKFLGYVQGRKIYRYLVKKTIKIKINYAWELQSRGQNFLVAKKNGQVIAKLKLNNFSKDYPYDWWIFDLWVKWPYRGLGIGSYLTQEAYNYAAGHKAAQIRLFVFEDNTPALKLYEKMGFYRIFNPEMNRVMVDGIRKRHKIVLEKNIRENKINKLKKRLTKTNKESVQAEDWDKFLISFITSENFDFCLEKISRLDFNWNNFFKIAFKQKLAPLIFKNLSRNKKVKLYIPKSILSKFRHSYYATAAYNTLILRRLGEILRPFKESGIKMLFLKGPVLIDLIYKDIGLRPMSDIDLLIDKNDLEKTDNVLRSLGYISPINFRDALNNTSRSVINTLEYKKFSDDNFFIHIHWHLINCTWPLDFLVRKIEMGRIWNQARNLNIDGVDVLTLAPEHLVIYLAQHSFTHFLSPLILFADIIGVLKVYKQDLDRQVLIKEAERFNLSTVLYYCLNFISKRLGYDSPELENLKIRKNSLLEGIFNFYIFKKNNYYFFCYLVYFLEQKGFLSKLRFIKRTVFPSSYVMAHNLGILSSQIRIAHYCRRLVNYRFRFQ